VVDGQQRLATIFEFLSGELTLSDETAEEFGGATYAELPADGFRPQKRTFRKPA
jgi:uncharacterized protein with ParB-like and HNH nuclease domain